MSTTFEIWTSWFQIEIYYLSDKKYITTGSNTKFISIYHTE